MCPDLTSASGLGYPSLGVAPTRTLQWKMYTNCMPCCPKSPPAPENDGIVRTSDKDGAESFINFY